MDKEQKKPIVEIERKSSETRMDDSAVQALYKELTDTTETLTKSFDPGRYINRSDIKSFCDRFTETCKQYQIQGFRNTYIIRRDRGQTEKFTSLDRFLASDPQGGSLTAGLSIEFQFLIKPPSYEKYQEYKISLNIDSSDYTDRPSTEKFIFNMVGVPTFVFNVEYSDYTVARNFISMAEDWFNSLEEINSSPTLNFITKRFNFFTDSNLYSNIFSFMITSISVYFCYRMLDVWNINESNKDLLEFLIVVFLIVYTSRFIALSLSGFAIKQIGKYRVPNFVILNKIDENNFKIYKKKSRGIIRNICGAIFIAIITILLNIFSTYIYEFINS